MAKQTEKGRPVASGATPKPTKKMDKLIFAIFSVLPATTVEEIHQRVARNWKGDPITVQDVGVALSRVRRNAVKYGWTVPYVTGAMEKGRYLIAEVKPDGSRKPLSERDTRLVMQGAAKVASLAGTYTGNEAVALDVMRQRMLPKYQGATRALARNLLTTAQGQMKLLTDINKVIAAAA